MKPKSVLIALFMLVTVGLQASDEASDPEMPGNHRTPSSAGASVGFSDLSDGDVVPTEFTVRFSISGMGIAPAGVEIDNTGHYHLLIDVIEMPDFNQPLPATDNILHFGKGESETVLRLTEGEHTLQLLLADYAHVPHDPPVISDAINIVVSVNTPPQHESNQD